MSLANYQDQSSAIKATEIFFEQTNEDASKQKIAPHVVQHYNMKLRLYQR